jgi:hypothetical protein
MKVIFICTALITSLVLMGFLEKPHLKQHALNKQLYKELGIILQKAGSAYGEIWEPTDGDFLSHLQLEGNLIDKEIWTVEEAEALYNSVVQSVVTYINQNRRYRPYLSEFPFSEDQICLQLRFMDSKTGEMMQYPKVGQVLTHEWGFQVLSYKNGRVIQVQKPGAK